MAGIWDFLPTIATSALSLGENALNIEYLREAEKRSEELGREAIGSYYEPLMAQGINLGGQYRGNIDQMLGAGPQYTTPGSLSQAAYFMGGSPQNQYGGNIFGNYQPGGQFAPMGAGGAYNQLGQQTGGLQNQAMNSIMGLTDQSRRAVDYYGNTGFLDPLSIGTSYDRLRGQIGDVDTSMEAERTAARAQIGKAQQAAQQSSMRGAMSMRGQLSPDEMISRGQQQGRLRSDAIGAALPGVDAQYATAERQLQQGQRGQDIGLLQFAEGTSAQDRQLAAQLQAGMQGNQLGAAMGIGGQQLGATTGQLSGYQNLLSGNLNANLSQQLGQGQFGANTAQLNFQNMMAGRGAQMGEIGQMMGYGQQDISNLNTVEQERAAQWQNELNTNMSLYGGYHNQMAAAMSAAGGTLSGMESVAPQVNFSPIAQSINQMYMANMMPSAPEPKGGFTSPIIGMNCIDGNCLIAVKEGDELISKPLKDIKVGDLVLAGGFDYRRVIDKEYGSIPEDTTVIRIDTDAGKIVATDDHVVGGKLITEWKKGDLMPMFGGRVALIESATQTMARPCGDLRLEGDADYVTEDGFIVQTLLSDAEVTAGQDTARIEGEA